MRKIIKRMSELLKKYQRRMALAFLMGIQAAIILAFIPSLTGIFSGIIIPEHQVRAEAGMAEDLSFLLQQARRLAKQDSILAALAEKDHTRLISLTFQEHKSIGVDDILISDENGRVLSRTANPAIYGDYIYERTARGRAVSSGVEVSAAGDNQTAPLSIIGGVPINRGDDSSFAGIFVSKQLNDAYARDFQKTHLPVGVEIAFYNRSGSISGDSLYAQADRDALRIFTTEMVASNEFDSEKPGHSPGRPDVLLNDSPYHIHNFPLFDAEGRSVGGFLLIIPLRPLSMGVMVSAFLSVLFFICLALFRVKRPRFIPFKISANLIQVILAAVFFVAIFVISSFIFGHALDSITSSPYTIYNSTISLRPNSGILDQHTEFSAAIVVDTGGEAINAVEAVIDFDPKKVIVRDIAMEKSFCAPEHVVEKSINSRSGHVVIACIIPEGGFLGERGVVGELIIQPIKTGDFVLSFDDETEVLANDGLATNVLRFSENGSYQVIEISDYSPDSKFITSPRVYSETNPNPEKWYAANEVKFFWSKKRKGDRFQYAFNDQPNYVPNLEPFIGDNFASFPAVGDGVYYFHVAAERQGAVSPTAHYKVKIDNTLPPTPVIKISNKRAVVGEVVRLEFFNSDERPSYQKGFYVSLDEGTFLPVLPQLNMPFLEPGHHSIRLRVFDNAGNFSESFDKILVVEN